MGRRGEAAYPLTRMVYGPLGDQALVITIGSSIDEATHRMVRAVVRAIESAKIAGVTDVVPAYASVAIHYDPARVPGRANDSPYERLVSLMSATLDGIRADDAGAPRTVEIPVCYGGDLGPDLDDVARRHDLSTSDVVRIHSAGVYLVYMVGFMPGFAYLGGLSDQIATPRRLSPRTAVPAGTVGIGGNQTGVYPLESPGGWNLIGRTPVLVFDAARDEQTLLATGDRVRFTPITRREFDHWAVA